MFGLNPVHLLIILAIVLLLFGPSRLPQLGKSLGKTMKAIREGSEGGLEDDEDDQPVVKAKAKKPKVNDNPEDDEE